MPRLTGNETREELEKRYGIDLSPKAVKIRTIRDTVILFFVGVVYYFVVRFSDLGLKCYIHELTGLDCPACGTTRMIVAASKLDFMAAFRYNSFVFITFPYVVGEVIYLFYVNEAKKPVNKVNQIVLFTWVGLFILFGILRNIIPI